MVFFDWDSSRLSNASMQTIRQAAGAYKARGSANITAAGNADTSGPDGYNMALSLRRANAVKDALVREGVPRPRRSPPSATARRACWRRPATACASRRIAVSRSASPAPWGSPESSPTPGVTARR